MTLSPSEDFDRRLTPPERELIAGLTSPAHIQAFLDSLPYSDESAYRCPLSVLRDRKAHCYDGALFAAAMLRRLGDPPLMVSLYAERDDDHMLAIYKRAGGWGAVAKSNFVGLRFREPIYRSLRELIMSYFEVFYNVEREKTLRAYTRPVNLTAFDKLNWMTGEAGLDTIAERIDDMRQFQILTPHQVAQLTPVDERSYTAGMLGINEAGLYKL